MSRKTRNRKVSALVSAILFASSSYCSAAKIIADDIDNEWATYMNELTLKCIENENNCKLNYVFNSNSKYNRNTINRIESQLTKIIFDSALSDEKITPKEAVSKVVSIEDGETSFDSCLYSFIIDNSNYYFDLKTISVSNEDYITTVTINLDELVLIKDQIQKDDFSYFISMMDKTNSEETGKLRIDGVFEKENKLYVHKINSGYNISFDMNFGWICDLQDYELKVSSNQISVDMEMIKKHISLFQNSITFTDSKDNKNILINRKNNYSPKFSEIRKKCEVSTTNSNLWIKEVLINGNAVYIADNEFKSSIDISPFINSGTIKVSKDYNNSITVITYEKIITVPVYCIEDGREQLYKNEQFEIKLDNSDLYIDVDKYIFNNTGIVDSYLSKLIYQDYINNEIEENIDTSHTENKKRIYLKKDLSRLYYSKLSYINDNNNEDLFNQLTSFSFQKKTNEFYVNRSIDIKTIEKNNEENDFFKNNSLLINYYESSYSQSNNNTRINRTIIDIIPSREDLTIIRGFINKNDNNRLTNSLESPIYICHDIHPPNNLQHPRIHSMDQLNPNLNLHSQRLRP